MYNYSKIMTDSNQFLPVFVAPGVAILGCATAFYFSDSDNSTKRKKSYPIRTKNFDDDTDSYDGDYKEAVKTRKGKNVRMGGAVIVEENEEEDDDESDESGEDDDESDESEEENDDEEDEEDDEEDRETYLVNKKKPTPSAKKQRNRK